MIFDYIDRQVIVSLFPYLKTAWGPSDKQLGALVSVVSLTVALGAVPVALFADRASRVKSIVVMAVIWSLATISCMVTRSYSQLLAARCIRRFGRGRLRFGGRCLDRQPLSVAHARRPAGRVLRVGVGWLSTWRHAGRLDRGALGLAGRLWRGRPSRSGTCVALYESTRLSDRGTHPCSGPSNPFDQRSRPAHCRHVSWLTHHVVGVSSEPPPS